MAEIDEPTESPWDDPSPTFKVIPSLNPKTKEPIQLYACKDCGSAVASRKVHSEWHRKQAGRRSWP